MLIAAACSSVAELRLRIDLTYKGICARRGAVARAVEGARLRKHGPLSRAAREQRLTRTPRHANRRTRSGGNALCVCRGAARTCALRRLIRARCRRARANLTLTWNKQPEIASIAM